MTLDVPDLSEADALAATSFVRWLLAAGENDGIGLTKTLALRRAVVREAAERWPAWWDHALVGPPHREADMPMLEETHAGLRRLRLMRRRREALLTTARGRELAGDPRALVRALHADMGEADRFDRTAWPLIEAELANEDAVEACRLVEHIGPYLELEGWRDEHGRAFDERSLWYVLHPLLSRGEGYGLLERRRGDAHPLRVALTPAGRTLASGPLAATRATAAAGDAALVFDADLLNARGVRARVAVLERQHLTAVHDALQEAFGWYDDHLYSFFLDGSFFGDAPGAELTTPETPDEGVATADVPVGELALHLGQRIGYVFDFGDDWRVRLTVDERVTSDDDGYPRVLEVRGSPPPQYPPFAAE